MIVNARICSVKCGQHSNRMFNARLRATAPVCRRGG
jgi:hypothetical protein